MKTRAFTSAAIVTCVSMTSVSALADAAPPAAQPAPAIAKLNNPGLPQNVEAIRFDYFNGTQIMCWVHQDKADEADARGNRMMYTALEDGRVVVRSGKANAQPQTMLITQPQPGSNAGPTVTLLTDKGQGLVRNADEIISSYKIERKACADALAGVASELQAYPNHSLPIGMDLTPRSRGGAIVRIHAYQYAR